MCKCVMVAALILNVTYKICVASILMVLWNAEANFENFNFAQRLQFWY